MPAGSVRSFTPPKNKRGMVEGRGMAPPSGARPGPRGYFTKSAWYSLLLLSVFFSPGTAFTSTVAV